MPSLLKKTYFYSVSRHQQRGTALLLALVLASFILSISLIIVEIQLNELKFSIKENFSNKALMAADAGLERALYHVYQETSLLPDSCTTIGCYIPTETLDNGATYNVIVPRGNDNPVVVGTSTEYIIIRSIGSFRKVQRSLEVNLYKKIPSS